jgi:hypothetical protein
MIRHVLHSAKLLPVLLAVTTFSAAAATYYVDPGGNSGNTGTLLSPFREIRTALTKVGPGDTVLVNDGQYLGFNVSGILGTAANPITIQATGSGAIINVTTDRSDNRDTIFITNASTYVIIDGLHSSGANRSAMRIDQCAHITVRNCVFGNNTMWGIFTDFSDFLLLEGNECFSSQQQHGIYVSNTCNAPTVRGNLLHDNSANGLHMNGDVSQGGAGIITNAMVENNIIYNNGSGGGSGINCDGVQSSTFRNNLIYSALGAGISLYQIDASQPSNNNIVINNTIDIASTGKWAIQIHNGSTGNVVFNNILLTHNAGHGSIHMDGAANLTGFVSDYNILTTNGHCVTLNDDSTYLSAAQWQATGRDTHSITATQAAVFVSATDFHLKPGSPALDIGISTLSSDAAPTTDLEGNPRPAFAGYDLGSYELQPVVLTINSTSPLAVGTMGSPYLVTLNASGGTKPYAWTLASGALPGNLSLSGTGTISGTPAAAGTFNFSVTVTDAVNATATKAFSITVNAVTITTASPLPNGTVGTAYSQTFGAIGGTQSYTWSLTAGTLPAGLALSSGGVLSGTPSAAGTASFTIQAKDGGNVTDSKVFALTIAAPSSGGGPVPPNITSPPNASSSPVVVNVPVTFSAGANDASGGTVSYLWNFGDGTTGTGASVSHTFTSVGAFTVTVTFTGSNGGSTTATLPVTVITGGTTPTTIPMTVSKLQGSANFKSGGKDSCSISGVLPNQPPLFNPSGKTLTLNLGGALVTFTLDTHGRGKAAQGTIALKVKTKRDPKTKKSSFPGGDVPFMAKIQKGTWAATWSLDPNTSATKQPQTFPATILLDGNTYAASVAVLYTAKAQVSGKFKK